MTNTKHSWEVNSRCSVFQVLGAFLAAHLLINPEEDLLLETSYHPENYIVRLILLGGSYSAPVAVGETMWTETNDAGKGWDGRSVSNPVQSGVYAYQLVYAFEDEKRRHMTGDITLLR